MNLKVYTKEEVFNETLKYFNGDILAAEVWIKKYCLKDSFGNLYELSPDDMHRRIAKELFRIESKYPNPISEEEIYETLKKFNRIIPGGSPMSGIGNNFQIVSISNCFVIGNKKDSDSYGGIMKLDQDVAQLQKRRGGVGVDLSFIRPKGSPVKNSALTSTGVVPFMERYSSTTKEVAQDGRRGALMESISINHPDAEDFIDAKFTKGKVTGANVSVKITNDFMQSVIGENKEFWQTYPLDLKIPLGEQYDNLVINAKENEIVNLPKVGYLKKVNAERIWKKIIHNAWKSAEPGLLFWDNIINESIPDCYQQFGFKTVSTNPCVSEDTLILTDKGYFKIIDKLNQKVNIWNGQEFSEVIPSITGYNQKMLKITFSDGSELKCTPYHGFYTWEGFSRDGKLIKKEAKDLNIGDKLEKYDFPVLNRKEGNTYELNSNFNLKEVLNNLESKLFYTLGFFQGDGTWKNENTPIIYLYGKKKNLIDRFEIDGNINENNDCDRLTFKVKLPAIASVVGFDKIKKFVPKINDLLQCETKQDTLAWLAGLIDSDGSRNSEEGSISISSIDKEFLMNIKLHILNTFGVNGSIIDEKEGGLHKIKGVEYECNKSYRLIISAYNVKKLYNLGLRTYRIKIDDINPNRDASRYITVTSIEDSEDAEKVYCFTEPIRGRGCFNGVVTSNCGEIPLCPNDSCRLLSLNLFGYVRNPFTSDSYFDMVSFKKDVQIAQRYMDDIIDLEIEKIDSILDKIKNDPEDEQIKIYETQLWSDIKDMTIKGRRTGLGITAEGDMLAALGLRYGTDEATDFSVEVHKTLKLEAYRSSVTMAKERGAFPIFNHDLEASNPFILRILDEDPKLHHDMWTYGRRNIALLTIAPTGTVSLMTQTTSGIEPVFLPVYKRRRKINPQEKDVRIDFTDSEGVAWQEYNVFHLGFEKWLIINGYDLDKVKNMTSSEIDNIVKLSPYYKATSNDVDWVKKVEMQGKIQQHIDHSISVTVNLPETVSEELVSKVYETGWKSGCKGITIYREGSRDGVLVSDKEKKELEKNEHFKDNNAPKRPKKLKGDIIRFQNNLEKWIAVVGLLDGRPYELFTGKLVNGLSKLSPTIKDCEIVKNRNEDGTSRYDLEYIDENGEKQISYGISQKFDPQYWNLAKMISGNMRHGMPLVYVHQLIESLNLNDDNLNTWKNGVARVIKRYIKDGVKGKGKCPECGSENLEYKEGCLTCMSCGHSKCS